MLLIQTDSANHKLWAAIGHCHLALKDQLQALNAYQESLKLSNNSDAEVLFGLAYIYMQIREFTQAERFLMMILVTSPDFHRRPQVHYQLGKALYN